MKKIRFLLIGLILGYLIGWVFGYLKIPIIEYKDEFWFGFCFALTTVVIIQLVTTQRKKSRREKHNTSKSFLSNLLLGTLLALIGWFGSQYFSRNNKSISSNEQKQLIIKQEKLLQDLHKESYSALLGNLLNAIDKEIEDSSSDTLSESLIKRISTVSFMLKPYRYINGDSLSDFELSPERGQLLLTLCNLNLDSLSFLRIKKASDFSMADLTDADLNGIDFSFANLEKACFKNAKLEYTKWRHSNLYQANFWGSELNHSEFHKSKMVRSNFEWSNLKSSTIDSCQMNGVIFNNAKLVMSNFVGTSIRWACFIGTSLEKTNLLDTDLAHSILTKVNFSFATLVDVNLRKCQISEINFKKIDIQKMIVSENWFELLKGSNSINSKLIFENYKLIEGKSEKYKRAKYFLVKRGKF